MSKEVTVLFGAPGTGKTTHLIGVVEKALKDGIDPTKIAYMSFSRKAARQAAEKATEKLGLPADRLPWFRTLHSAAYSVLGLRRHEVMNNAHFKELGSALGLVFHGSYEYQEDHAPIDLTSLGDRCLALYARAKARNWSLEDEWRYANDWDLPWATVNGFASNLEAYKHERGVVDFTDMIDMVKEPLDVEMMIIDEAQDLTPQQWNAARMFGANAKQVYLAGDDDQAIYNFSGATALPLLTVRGKRVVLPHSFRLPRGIKQLADKVSANIKTREHKLFSPRENDGLVTWLREPDDLDLSHGTWLLLCRNRSQVKKLEAVARRQSVVYYSQGRWSNHDDAVRAVVAYERIRRDQMITSQEARIIKSFLPSLGVPENQERFHFWSELTWPWKEHPDWMEGLQLSSETREYIRGLRRRNESLTKEGRVIISTVHGAKGGEAENVALMTDISGRVAKTMLMSPDEEWRVLYVGLSRAKERLFLIQPSTHNFWSVAA